MANKLNDLNAAGALLFIGVLQWFITVMAAETLFPGYSTRANDLSDLASTVPPNLSMIQPSATMFNAATFLVGLLTIVSAFLIYRAYGDRLFSVLFAISGAAAMAVGIFPGDTGTIHTLVALAWFVTAPLSAIAAYRLVNKPFGYFSVAIGVFALIVLLMSVFSGELSPFRMFFGRGGEERMLAYPVVLWMMGFGGYLMGIAQTKR
ncbi:MAG TPA: DUF998 domain-containing protein, partial [Methanotrichaceae archaeon]|nr:DUF998 domain-containing protein [Methanotrichaceae archaeon]